MFYSYMYFLHCPASFEQETLLSWTVLCQFIESVFAGANKAIKLSALKLDQLIQLAWTQKLVLLSMIIVVWRQTPPPPCMLLFQKHKIRLMKNLYCAFTDFERCFDMIDRSFLLRKSVQQAWWKCKICQSYTNYVYDIDINIWVKQGDPSSIFVNGLM